MPIHGCAHDQLADLVAHGPALIVHDVGGDARRRAGERRRLERREDVAADQPAGDFGAARVVDDRQPAAADDIEEPAPRLGVPRLAGRAEDAQRRQVVAANRLLAVAHQRADQRGRDAEDVDAVPLDERPQAIGARVVERAVVEHHRAAEQRHAERLPTGPSSSPCR